MQKYQKYFEDFFMKHDAIAAHSCTADAQKLSGRSTSSILALVFLVSLCVILAAAWILGIPLRPIIYATAVYIGPILFIVMGLLRSKMMAMLHLVALFVAWGITLSNFDQAVTLEKQLVFEWFPIFLGLWITFYIVHLIPKRKTR